MINRTRNITASQADKLERRVRAHEKSATADLARALSNLTAQMARLEDLQADLSKAVIANANNLDQMRRDIDLVHVALDAVKDTKA